MHSHFTSVNGTTDNESLPVSGKVVPQAPDDEVYYRINVGEGLAPPDKICTDFNDGSSDHGLRPGLCPAHPPLRQYPCSMFKLEALPRLPLEGAVAAGD